MRKIIKAKEHYPAKVRGRTAKVTEKGHEHVGRYIWVIEVFIIPATGKITIMKTLQSLYFGNVPSYEDEHKAKQGLQHMVDKIEASLEKTEKLTGVRSGLIALPGAFE